MAFRRGSGVSDARRGPRTTHGLERYVPVDASNALAGLFQGFVASGGSSQSAASDQTGARTELFAVAAGLTLLTAVALALLLRDERSEYHGITVERAQRVLDAMGESLTTRVVERPLVPAQASN